MTIIAINMSDRIIDKIAPQEHREITEQQAEIYRRVLPKEIKIVETNENVNPTEEVVIDNTPAEEIVDNTIVGPSLGEDEEVDNTTNDGELSIVSTNVEGQEDIF